ncbi:type 1 glutamine amidotransferase domain-containing protein [Micrococcus endophyticus]|uniref:type 1 glutamine amidotransferase domain-containing protein n=1 Tax=Micrococcus endophyticus TaxID=455343 RepID=UPI0034CDE71A
MPSVLFVLSASDHWTLKDGTRHETGFWAEEFVVPHDVFADAGWDATVATPGGVAPTVDQTSLGLMGGAPWKTARLKRDLERLAPVLDRPVDLASVDEAGHDVVFYPGGHGPLEDLSRDPVSGELLRSRMAGGRLTALLCHSPAAMLAVPGEGADWPFAGFAMTAFSDTEEKLTGLAGKAPWLLEDELRRRGADYSSATLPYRPHVVVDRHLHTGQNPQSSRPLAERILADAEARR